MTRLLNDADEDRRPPATAPVQCVGPPYYLRGILQASGGRRGFYPSDRISCPLASAAYFRPLLLVAAPVKSK